MPAWDRRGLAQRFSAKRKRRWPSPFAICSVPCKPPFGTSRDHIVAPPRWCGCPAIPCCNMSNPWSNRKEMVGHKQQLTLTVIRPADGIRWHRAGSRAYWRCKSRPRGSPQSSASMSGKAQPPNTWQSVSGLRLRAGGRFCAITPTASRRWTSPWVRGVQLYLFGCPIARTSAPTSISCDEIRSGRTVRFRNERGRTNARSR